jgi:catechol 2,3-dioxygenase
MDTARGMPITPSTVDLNASSRDALSLFYAGTLGLVEIAGERGTRIFAAGERPIVTVTPATARHAPTGASTGLYHLAILVPSRLDLARVLRRLLERDVALQGAADHGVSEALYLADPEGNGIEIYADRPQSAWPRKDGEVEMFTRRFDFDGVLDELRADGRAWDGMALGTRLGHVHLKVSDLKRAEDFYRRVIGFDLMLHYGDSAAFLSTSGYHHHVGLNTWESLGRTAPERGAEGLRQVTFTVDDAARLRSIEGRAAEAGVATVAQDGELVLTDPSGIQIALTAGSEPGSTAGRMKEPAHNLQGAQPAR